MSKYLKVWHAVHTACTMGSAEPYITVEMAGSALPDVLAQI